MAAAGLSAVFLPPIDLLLRKCHFYFDLHRVYSRLFLVFALAGFFIFSSPWHLKSVFKDHFQRQRRMHSFVSAFLAGSMILILITIGAYFTEIRVLKQDLSFVIIFKGLILSMMTGVVVGIFETLIVWGVIYVFLREDFGQKISLWGTSFVYAFVHFLRSQETPPSESFQPLIGFRIFFHSFENLLDIQGNGYYMVGLFLLGIFFCLLFEKTKDNVFAVAGIHAGAVFMIKFNRVFLGFSRKDWEWLFGTSPGIDSVAGWIIILLLIVFLLRRGSSVKST